MKNRYILDPSGKIKRFNTENNNEVSPDIDLKTQKSFYGDMPHFANREGIYHETYFGSSDEDLLRVDGDIIDNSLPSSFGSKIKYVIENDNAAFGFIEDQNQPAHTAFRQLNSFLDTDTGTTAAGSNVIPFVDEFEFYTGVRQITSIEDNVELLGSSLVFIIDYLADVAIEAAVVEALMALNKTTASNSKEGNRLDGLKNSGRLVLGEYILDEVDVFSKYFFEVLNYPIEEGKVAGSGAGLYFLKRLTCYFIGLSEWLVQDRVLDWQKLLEKASGDKMFGNIAIGKEASLRNVDANFAVIVASVVDVTLNSLTNSAALKRMMLLIKKFHTQKYWVNYQLYSAKRSTYENVIIDSFNYYYFKFFIERVNVGIKIWNRNFAEDSVKNLTKNPDRSTNRLSGELYGQKENKDFVLYNNDQKEFEVKRSAKNAAESGQKVGNLTKKASDILKDDTIYEFDYNFNNLSLSNIPTALMFNRTISNVAKDITEDFYAAKKKYFAKTKNNRLPIKLVNRIEKKLESEYMPFYFHDIRTNEIISFHAFIENISDSYSPDYTATGGFGRIDDVRTYNKTTRSISLSFTVAAMNKEDHDTMWYYINKLVTMVYPQWTKGESLIADGILMQQPFSQVPSNSPLIRLRIGDVIKNNYSRFNLARIFGLDEALKISEIEKDKIIKVDQYKNVVDWKASGIDIEKKKSELIESVQTSAVVQSNVDSPKFADVNYDTVEHSKRLTTYITSYTELKDAKPALAPLSFLEDDSFCYLMFRYNKKVYIETGFGFFELEVGENAPRLYEELRAFTKKRAVSLGEPFDLIDTKKNIIAKEKIKYKKVPTGKQKDEVTKVKEEVKSAVTDSDIEKIMRPFDSEGNINNPITQSYESGMSKGLAGHITQLDLNYNDATWEIKKDSKAPMMVKVTMSFAPIHDIPPGLDYKGMPRAANYNVGDVNLSMFGDPLQKYKGEE